MKWDSAVTAVLVACALVTTGLVMRRELFPSRPQLQKPEFVENWRANLATGVRLGSPHAPVQLIEFADFECSFCADFHARLKSLRERYPSEVALSFIHFPLPGHRFAEPAARVAECAGEQGRFEQMHDRLFEQQQLFGVKSWSEFAAAAGVPNLAAFQVCMQKDVAVPRIVAGLELAERMDILGTPTLIVNGWKLGHPPSEAELERMIRAVLAGNSPIAAD